MITIEIEAHHFPHKRNFNGCLFNYKGRQIMAYRAEDIDRGIDPRIMICDVSDDYVPSNFKEISIPRPQPTTGYFEDPRLFEHNGRLWMSFIAAAMKNKHHFAAQGVALLNDNYEVERVFYPDWGYNHNEISKGNGLLKREKNWTFFSRNQQIHVLYTINPLKVGVMNEYSGEINTIRESRFDNDWEYGVMHGSTGLIDLDGTLFGCFHSYILGKDHQRAYHCGFYEIDPAKWIITSISREPFLSAVRDEPKDLRSRLQPYRPNAIFPCGILMDKSVDKKEVKISYGWQDCRAMVAIERMDKIKDKMFHVEHYFSPQDVILDGMSCIPGGFRFTAKGEEFRSSHWNGFVREAKKRGVSEELLMKEVFPSIPKKYKVKKWLPEIQ